MTKPHRIKVAFFADILSVDFDGASRTMHQIISRIDHSAFDYFFITGHNEMPESKNLNIIESFSLSIPLQKRYKMALPQVSSKKLSDKLDEFSPDVIHIATPSTLGFWAIKYAKKRNIPVITIYHTYFSSYLQYYFKRFPRIGNKLKILADRLQNKFYNRADTIYAPSLTMKNELEKINVNPQKIKIWARGIDTTLFNIEKRNSTYIQTLTGNTNINILFVSRLVWEKNLDALIGLYEKCQANEMKVNFIVAGDGHAKKELMKKMNSAIFPGNLDHVQLSRLYASCDLLFFPSITETFGNVVLEGLASGLPAIVSDMGGTKDMINDGVNGFICKTNDVDDYFEKINFLMNEKDALLRMSEAALESSHSYDWSTLTQSYFADIVTLAKAKVNV